MIQESAITHSSTSNITGDGPVSSTSNSITVLAKLTAPTDVVACGADGQVTVRFAAVRAYPSRIASDRDDQGFANSDSGIC